MNKLRQNNFYKNDTTVTVSANCTVYARLYDGTNTGSNASLDIENIDTVVPSTASLSVTDYDDESITVKATGADALSGVAKYAFQISTDNSSWTTESTISSTESIYSYTYSSLSSGTTYYMRVIVYDTAGNSTTSSSISKTTDSGVLYLYYYGDECEDVTGGWTGTQNSAAMYSNKSKLEDTYMYFYDYYYSSNITDSADTNPNCYPYTEAIAKNSIDAGEYTSINVLCDYYMTCPYNYPNCDYSFSYIFLGTNSNYRISRVSDGNDDWRHIPTDRNYPVLQFYWRDTVRSNGGFLFL